MWCIHMRQKIQWMYTDYGRFSSNLVLFHFQNIFSFFDEGINNQQHKKLWIWLCRYLVHDINPFLFVEIVDVCFFLFNDYNCKSFCYKKWRKQIYRSRNYIIANHPKRPAAISEKVLNKQITKNDLYFLQ